MVPNCKFREMLHLHWSLHHHGEGAAVLPTLLELVGRLRSGTLDAGITRLQDGVSQRGGWLSWVENITFSVSKTN